MILTACTSDSHPIAGTAASSSEVRPDSSSPLPLPPSHPADATLVTGHQFNIVATSDAARTYPKVDAVSGPSIGFGTRLTIDGGCNGMTADYSIDPGGYLTVTGWLVTTKGCLPAAILDQEQRIFATIVTGARLTVAGNTLTITDGPRSITMTQSDG